ncbi:MAG TPA: hypothetical protein PK887_05695 [Ignavibacteriales bacterium]|nr:hypothetical protein [Ignavibacteriales bacterium]
MPKKYQVFCCNNNQKYEIEAGTSLLQLIDIIKPDTKFMIVGALVNNEVKELDYEIFAPKYIKFFDASSRMGMRMYTRGLSFVLSKAFYDLYPNAILTISHPVSRGLFCEVDNLEITEEVVSNIKNKMIEIINKDIPFVRKQIETDEAIKLYEKYNQPEKIELLKFRKHIFSSVYFLEDRPDYFYGFLPPSTGYLKVFDLFKFNDGLLLKLPKRSNPNIIDENVHQNKLFGILKEHSEWAEILGVKTVGNINATIDNGEISDIIKISEALQEKKIAQIADQIHSKSDVKFVLISGPSSSGKTSFCKRLDIQLRVLGYKPINISLDDYFVDRELTPRDENGDYDFECLEAIDIQQFNRDMIDLLDGKEVELPKFNFSLGKGFPSGKKIKAHPNTIFLIEGIHGLNPKLSQLIEDKFKFKIYVSALTTILLDRHNRISTTDNRLMRRLVRDYYYRGYSAYATLSRWESVTRGEQKNIFPFQENADVMFNSSLLYEIGVLKPHLTKILVDVPENVEEYAEAKRLLKLLTYFKEIPEKEIPPTSIIREFFGGSSFKY